MFVETLEAFFGAGLWAVIKAVLILLLAFIVSAVVKSAVTKLLAKTKLGKGAEGQEAGNALTMIGKLVHLVVFLLFVPGIFESLGLNNVSAPILRAVCSWIRCLWTKASVPWMKIPWNRRCGRCRS